MSRALGKRRYPWVGVGQSVVDSGAHLDPSYAHVTVLELSTALAALGHGFEMEQYHPVLQAAASEWWAQDVSTWDALVEYGAADVYLEPRPGDDSRVSMRPREAWTLLRAAVAAREAVGTAPAPPPARTPAPAQAPAPPPAAAAPNETPPVLAGGKSPGALVLGIAGLVGLALALGKR